jgi:predicted DNA-binding transcriptional regulator AlpA
MSDDQKLIPPPPVIHERLTRNQRERGLLRALFFLAILATKVRPCHEAHEPRLALDGRRVSQWTLHIKPIRPPAAPRADAPPPIEREAVRPVAADPTDSIERLPYRLDELATALGVSRRSLERARSAGRLPRPDLQIGKMPLWRPATIRDWIERGGK